MLHVLRPPRKSIVAYIDRYFTVFADFTLLIQLLHQNLSYKLYTATSNLPSDLSIGSEDGVLQTTCSLMYQILTSPAYQVVRLTDNGDRPHSSNRLAQRTPADERFHGIVNILFEPGTGEPMDIVVERAEIGGSIRHVWESVVRPVVVRVRSDRLKDSAFRGCRGTIDTWLMDQQRIEPPIYSEETRSSPSFTR